MQSEKPKSHKCSFSMLEREHLFPKKQKKYSSYYHICNDFTIFSVYSVVKIQRLKQFYRDKGCVEYYIRMAIQVLSVFDPSSVQFSHSVVLDSLPPHELRMPGLPVHHQLPKFLQTHVRVGDAIQPSHPLSSPFPPALKLFQHQGLFQRVNSSHEVAKVLEFQL